MPCVTYTTLPGTNLLFLDFGRELMSPRGTKGDNTAPKDLGGAKQIKGDGGKVMMEIEIPTAREDVDQLWAASRAALKVKPPEEKEHRDAATKQSDRDRSSRTNVVLTWVATNMQVLFFLCVMFSLIDGSLGL